MTRIARRTAARLGVWALVLLPWPMAHGAAESAADANAPAIEEQAADGLRYFARRQHDNGAVYEGASPAFEIWETINSVIATKLWSARITVGTSMSIQHALEFLSQSEAPNGLVLHGRYLKGAHCVETSSEYLHMLHLVAGADDDRLREKLDTLLGLQSNNGAWPIGNPEVRPSLQRFPSVTGFALGVLADAGKPVPRESAALTYLVKTQNDAGHWGEAWEYYGTPYYALAPILQALQRGADRADCIRAVESAREYLLRSQEADGHWSYASSEAMLFTSPEFQTALALRSCQAVGIRRSDPAYQRGLAWLLSRQRRDGGWNGGFFPHPDPHVRKPADVTATAYALMALHAHAVSAPADATASLQVRLIETSVQADGSIVLDMKAADLDGDGRMDLVISKSKITAPLSGLLKEFYTATGHGDSDAASDPPADPDSGPPIQDDIRRIVSGRDVVEVHLNRGGGRFESLMIPAPLGSPALLHLADIDGDGDLDIIAGVLGSILPSQHKGGVMIIENRLAEESTENRLAAHAVAYRGYRVVAAHARDLDRDGDSDILVATYGNEGQNRDQPPLERGHVAWLENLGDWNFATHLISDKDGALAIVDLTPPQPDQPAVMAVLLAETHEAVSALDFRNPDRVSERVLYAFENSEWGSNRLRGADVDSDNDLDLIWANGDRDDFIRAGNLDWHGITWLEQRDGEFISHRVGRLPGVYNVLAVDIDRDGDIDVIASRVLGRITPEDPAPLGLFRNDGRGHFGEYVPLSRDLPAVLVMEAADFDGDGAPDLAVCDLMTQKIYLMLNIAVATAAASENQ